jgi:superoxide dismutase, Cu-Zn family
MRSAPVLLALCVVVLAACERTAPGETATNPTVDSAIAAITGDPVTDTVVTQGDTAYFRVARMVDRNGRELGTLRLVDHPGSIGVTGGLSGLPPGTRAIHIHQTGACEPPSFESAGDHWNPQGRQHGLENPQGPHLGDLPNITVGENGIVEVNVNTPAGNLRGDGGAMDADGASVVIHAGPDDHRTDPSGDSGDRIACGVITAG